MVTLVNIMVEKRKCSVVKCLTVTLGITGAGKTTWLKDKSPVVETDIPSENGMLYKHSIVKLDEWNDTTKKIRVTDNLGKVWWIEPSEVSCSFL